jgi:hypothetical protein
MKNQSHGPLMNVGTTCMLSHENLAVLLINEGFKILKSEKHFRNTDDRQKELIYYIIEVRRV